MHLHRGRSLLLSLAFAVAASSGHPRTSLLGASTVSEVAAARSRARAALTSSTSSRAAAAAQPPAGVRLDVRVPSAHAPPSGLVEVEVRWTSPHSPAAGEDVITLSCAGAAPVWDVADFLAVPAGAGGATTLLLPHGTGCAYTLAYEAGGGALFAAGSAARWATAARAALPPLGADTDAAGTRLALGDAPGDVLLTWSSLNGSAPAYVSVGTARGGPYPLRFDARPPRSYAAADMCHAPASEAGPTGYVFPGYFHTAALNLSAGTRYYAVYGQEGGALAPETTFKTRPAPGPDVPAKFAAFGDAATYFIYPGTVTTVDDIAALAAQLDDEGSTLDFVTNIGDLAYAEGGVLLWAFWTGMLWPMTSKLPFQVTVGNHEVNVQAGSCKSSNPVAQMADWPGPAANNTYGDDSGGEAGVATFMRYSGPASGNGVFWYSMDVGSVHFVLWSSEHDYTPGSAQEQWLRADLLGVDRAQTPWLVVGMHRPMFNVRADGDFTIDQGMARNLEALFLEAKVDLALSGHYHLYERTHSIRNYTVDATGASPVYVTVGTGGATFHNESMIPELAFLSAYDDDAWGFALVEAFNRSALRVSYRPNIDGGLVRDEGWILRPERG